MLQNLKTSCKLFSIGFGLVSSCLTFHYQQSVGITVNENLLGLRKWLEWKTKEALDLTESCLLHYCRRFSTSTLFHQVDITNLVIHLANSKNILLHDFGVKLLSVIEHPDDVDLDRYKSKFDYTVLIGLARIKNGTTEKWFQTMSIDTTGRGMNSTPDDEYIRNMKERLDNSLIEIRRFAPAKERDCSSWLFNKLTFDRLPVDPVTTLMSDFCSERDSSISSRREAHPFHKDLLTYLEILRRYSSNEVLVANKAVSIEILRAVKEIMDAFPNQRNVLMCCGNIIANLATNDQNRESVVKCGFLTSIMDWKFSMDTSLEIVADRVLYNLDIIHNKVVLQEGLYILYPDNRTDAFSADVDVVFVHGIHGSPFYTWRQNDQSNSGKRSTCWPKDWLPNDFPNARIICVQYESSLSDWLLSCPIEKVKYSLDMQANNIKKKLQDIGVGKRPIVWVCHSMGGIIVKKMLLSSGNFIKTNSEDLLCSTKGVVFYSVPHLGSPIASQSEKAKYILFPSIEVNELTGKGNKLKDLHLDFVTLKEHFHIDCVDIGESKPLILPYVKFKTVVVPVSSCNVGYGSFILLDDANHQETCKPKSTTDIRYKTVVEMVSQAANHQKNR